MNSKMKYCPQCAAELVIRVIDNIDRKACATDGCNYVFWNSPTPVVAIIAEVEEGIVLAHNRKWPPGVFSIISGFIEERESPENTAVRELKEELGLDATEVLFVGNFIFERLNQLMVVFHIRAKGDIQLNDELDEVKVVQKDQLKGWKRRHEFEVTEWLESLSVLEGQ